MLAFTLIGIAARTLPAAVAMVKADLTAAKAADSPHGAVVGADEVLGMAYHLGMLLAEQFAPAIAKAHGVTLAITAAPLPMPASEQIMLTPVIVPGAPRHRPEPIVHVDGVGDVMLTPKSAPIPNETATG